MPTRKTPVESSLVPLHPSISWVSYDAQRSVDAQAKIPPCVVTAAAGGSVNGNTPADILTLSRSDPDGPYGEKKVEGIRTLLSAYKNNNDVTVYVYRKQLSEDILAQGAWGKAAVSRKYRLAALGTYY